MNKKYGQFRIGDLFDVDNLWIYGKNKQYNSRLENPTSKSLAVISGVTTNNGVNYYTEDKVSNNEIFCDCLTISTRGEYSGTVTYHDTPFVLANNILAMPMPNLNKEEKLYIGTCISKLGYGGYVNYPKKETLKNDFIFLPLVDGTEDKIDFFFMSEKIREMEAEKIREMEAYFKVSGLNDCELTEDDKAILSLPSSGKKKYGQFRIGDVFEIKSSNGIFHAINIEIFDDPIKNSHPYVVRTSQNNGIRGYIIEKESSLNPANTISFAQDTAEIFYREEPYFTGNKIKVMSLKNGKPITQEIAMYLITAMKKGFAKFSWGSSFDTKLLNETFIYLPLVDGTSDQIDFEYMEKYIHAMQKVVIADVVKYKDEMIEKTKEIIHSEKEKI
jgi:hypothetical protein